MYCVLFFCKCVLNYCQQVATQLQLINISYRIMKCNKIYKICREFIDLFTAPFLYLGRMLPPHLFWLAVVF
jgi:hypothetical protein